MADAREYFADREEALKAMQDGNQATIWTSFPGIIESFNAGKVTASVQPSIQARRQSQDGAYTMVSLPVLQDVPVVFERGGGFIMAFPVAKGDECVVWISSRCIDSWWQSGGVQPPAHPRMHDLSDGFCKVGPSSQANLPGAVSTSSVQIRQVGGPALLDISAAGFAFAGNVTITGGLTTAKDVVANGISVENHLHSDAGGSGNSGPPVPGT